MSNIIADFALVIGAYLLGSFPYMLILSRARGVNIPRGADFHISMWRNVGRTEGASGVAGDVLKGSIPVIIGFVFDFRLAVIASAGVAAVIGQMWPVFQKFNGEKGNTTGAGMAVTLISFLHGDALWAMFGGLACFLIGFLVRTIPRFMIKGQNFNEKLKLGGPVSNSMPAGMLAGFFVMPLVSWLLNQPVELTLALAVTFIAIAIRRLTANLGKDLKEPKTNLGKILFNRFLYDRSYF
jgi:glycerol-3-phosphate acyltransferase PlsY